MQNPVWLAILTSTTIKNMPKRQQRGCINKTTAAMTISVAKKRLEHQQDNSRMREIEQRNNLIYELYGGK